MNVRLSRVAEAQLVRLLTVAVAKVVDALRVLGAVPHSGLLLPEDSPFAGTRTKLVSVRRGWSYRIVYRETRRGIFVLLIVPSWYAAQR